MYSDQLQQIIQKGEGITVEFKTSKNKLNKNSFETICAFLNRQGGHLLLGVEDNGIVSGVEEEAVQMIVDSIVTNANNPQKLSPPYYLSPHVVKVNGRNVIVVYVPESSQVHNTIGRIFDRNEDGDFDITNQSEQVTQLYLRKQSSYTENKVYPYVSLDDFKKSLFDRIRILARSQRPDHPWLEMTDEELLKSAGLYKKDMQTGESGYTLAAVLLLGKDEVITNVLPHFKTDAIVRIQNIDRYDDRDDIRVNLIESYDRLMSFIGKHLPEKFHIENNQRINLRDRIFREVIGNVLIHREFTNPYPAKLIVESGRVYTENWNKPHGRGNINPKSFSPYPKNPMIARFFKEIGRVDELGSGVRNTYKYSGLYTPGTEPEFIEGDVFKAIIPIYSEQPTEQPTEQVSFEVVEEAEKVVLAIEDEMKLKELMEKLGLSHRENFKKNYLEPAMKVGFVEMTHPESPNHPSQMYRLTAKGKLFNKKKNK